MLDRSRLLQELQQKSGKLISFRFDSERGKYIRRRIRDRAEIIYNIVDLEEEDQNLHEPILSLDRLLEQNPALEEEVLHLTTDGADYRLIRKNLESPGIPGRVDNLQFLIPEEDYPFRKLTLANRSNGTSDIYLSEGDRLRKASTVSTFRKVQHEFALSMNGELFQHTEGRAIQNSFSAVQIPLLDFALMEHEEKNRVLAILDQNRNLYRLRFDLSLEGRLILRESERLPYSDIVQIYSDSSIPFLFLLDAKGDLLVHDHPELNIIGREIFGLALPGSFEGYRADSNLFMFMAAYGQGDICYVLSTVPGRTDQFIWNGFNSLKDVSFLYDETTEENEMVAIDYGKRQR